MKRVFKIENEELQLCWDSLTKPEKFVLKYGGKEVEISSIEDLNKGEFQVGGSRVKFFFKKEKYASSFTLNALDGEVVLKGSDFHPSNVKRYLFYIILLSLCSSLLMGINQSTNVLKGDSIILGFIRAFDLSGIGTFFNYNSSLNAIVFFFLSLLIVRRIDYACLGLGGIYFVDTLVLIFQGSGFSYNTFIYFVLLRLILIFPSIWRAWTNHRRSKNFYTAL